MKIGVIVDCLGLPIEEGVVAAAKQGFDGIQMYAVNGRTAPWNLTARQRKNLLELIESNGLEVSALCGDFGGHGFQLKEENQEKIEKSREVLQLAKDLGSNIVTTHIGIIPKDGSCEIYETMFDACLKLDSVAKELDGYFAIETGCETALELGTFIKKSGTGRICVNYDPANLVMVTNDDPVSGVELLKEYIVHTHAKDGIFKKSINPKIVYGYPGFKEMSHDDISRMVTSGEYFEETPLGKGQVDFSAYIQKLHDIGYNGYLTIEREVKENPIKDIAEAIAFLKQNIRKTESLYCKND